MGECIEKRFLFFEHKGTRIFETRKPLFEKKPHIPCFLNYQPILTNKTLLFLDKPSLYGLSHLSTYSFSVSLRASTRNLILRLFNATRCVPTGLIGWDAGACPARHGWYIALFACPKVYRKKEPFFDTLPKKSSANSIYNIMFARVRKLRPRSITIVQTLRLIILQPYD